MLGSSANNFNNQIASIVKSISPKTILELGCGKGKFSNLVKHFLKDSQLCAVQKLFTDNDSEELKLAGYDKVIDKDILDYFTEGFDDFYDLVVALDVIEHFLHSDAIDIIKFALYRCDYLLLVWPSKHPQNSVTSTFDRHRTTFELPEIARDFDIVYYCQTGFAQINSVHRYHICLIRGHMNYKNYIPYN